MRQLYTFLLFFVCYAWTSCSSDKGADTFQVKMSVTALGVEKEYTVKEIADPTDEMTVESVQPSWVSVDLYTDENDQWVVVVVVDENTEEQERLHQLVIKAQNGNKFVLDITQKGCQYFETSLQFPAKGESKEMTLEQLTPPVVDIEGSVDWLEFAWESETSRDVTITTNANPSDAERSARVIIKDSHGNRTILSVQQGFFADESDSSSGEETDQPAL